MGNPYIGEIRMVGFSFAPSGWAFCDGSIIEITQNEALFQTIGTTYGGDGITTFGLPDLRARVPVHNGQGPGVSSYVIGEVNGEGQHTLRSTELPSHTHTALGASGGPQVTPVAQTWGDSGDNGNGGAYAIPPSNSQMSAQALGQAGGGQPHNNMSPYLGLNFIISLNGLVPSRT
jgi:microcystin-dependent protein